jgi:hypothetical protein
MPNVSAIGVIASSLVLPPQTVNLNLTDGSHPSNLSAWQDITTMFAPTTTIHNSAGAVTGWTLTPFNFGALDFFDASGPNWNNADFPNVVINSQYSVGPGSNSFGFTLAGLNTGKTYTVKTVSADSAGGDGVTQITVGGVTHDTGVEPNNIAIEVTFTGITCNGSGNLLLTVFGSGFPLLNAVIVIEN